MDFTIPEETKMMVSLMRQFVEKECLPVEQEMLKTDPDFVELPEHHYTRLRNKARDLGLWGASVPKEFGGPGFDTVTRALLMIEQAKTIIGTLVHNPFESKPPIIPSLYTASDYLKENYLHPLLKDEKRAALGHTEPDAGSDATAIKTTAVKHGDYWTINGIKRFCSEADRADFIYITALTDKTKRYHGITTFIVDTNTPGLTIRPMPVLRPQHTTETTLDDVVVHDRQRLTALGEGLRPALEIIGGVRIILASDFVGRCERALAMTVDYVKQRVTFGQPLAKRQAIQFMLVDSLMEIKATKLMTLEMAWKNDQGLDIRVDASMLKLMSTEMAFRVIDRCIQCHGGIGLTKELPLERWFREVRVARIVDGASEIQKLVIARDMLNQDVFR